MDEFRFWMEKSLRKLSPKSETAAAIYSLIGSGFAQSRALSKPADEIAFSKASLACSSS
jgi:hypothetical protein